MLFEKTRGKIDTLINDRITAPVQLAVIVSIAAFIVSGIALMIAAGYNAGR